MNTVVKKKAHVNGRRKWKTQDGAAIEPITMSEYLHRKNEQRKAIDELAPSLHEKTVRNAITAGYIEVVRSGDNYFIDWAKYGGYIFKTVRKVHKTGK